MPTESKPFFVTLPDRGLIHIEGDDRHDFLQGLITNDIKLLKTQPVIYACLLTPQGKFLYDFFVIEGDGFILLDCEGGQRAQDLYKRLNMYRLRSKTTLSVEESHSVYAGFGRTPEGALADPRHPDMGWRSFEKPDGMEEQPFSAWDVRRITLAIPDGSRDMKPERATMLESNIDKLNGVSFDKGCYVGQEVTARMKYRGLTKKHLYTLRFNDPAPPSNSALHIDGKRAGHLYSVYENVGIALLKDETATNTNIPFDILTD